MTEIGRCEINGCKEIARFLIGSLEREIRGENKWLHVCNGCDKLIASQNAKIIIEAQAKGMYIMDYVEKLCMGGKRGKARN